MKIGFQWDLVLADKGSESKANDRMLKDQGSKSSIVHKRDRNKPLSDRQKRYNKAINKTPWVVEQTFGSFKRWLGAGTTLLKGQDNLHSNHVL